MGTLWVGYLGLMRQSLLCKKGLDSQSPKGRTLPCLSRVLAHAGARHALNPTWIPNTASWLPFMIRCQSHTTTHPLQPFGCTSVSFAGLSLSLVFGNTPLKPRVSPTYLHWCVLLSRACGVLCRCDMPDVGHRWVQPILPYLGISISQIVSPIVHCHCNDSGALMLLHP